MLDVRVTQVVMGFEGMKGSCRAAEAWHWEARLESLKSAGEAIGESTRNPSILEMLVP